MTMKNARILKMTGNRRQESGVRSQGSGLIPDSCFLIPALLLLLLLLFPPAARAQGLVAAATIVRSQTATNAEVMVSRKTRCFNVMVTNQGSTDVWLHVFNTASVPANGTRPAFNAIKVAAGGDNFYDFGTYGAPMTTGVTVCTSTTDLTLTNAGAVFDITVTHTP